MMILLLFLLPKLYFFYSSECGHCYDILYGIIEDIEREKKARVFIYDITEPENYQLLEEFEQKYQTSGEKIPIVFFKGRGLYGNDEILRKLPGLIHPAPKTEIVFFTQSGCRACEKVGALLSAIKKEYPGLRIIQLDLRLDSVKIIGEALGEYLGVPEDKRLTTPTIYLDSTYLIKEEIRYQRLKQLIEANPDDTVLLRRIPDQYRKRAKERIMGRFRRMSILPIILAGLIDGINPCAFTTLIFFIAYLAYLGRRRSNIIKLTIAFAIGIFISYFSIGLGAFHLLSPLMGNPTLRLIFSRGFAAFAFILAGLSFYDYLLARRRREREMRLKLPDFLTRMIHFEIRKTGYLWVSGIITGLIVSILEFACTGQIYLPTITLMASTSLREIAVLALLIYNIAFLIPLFLIGFAATIFTSEQVGGYLRAKLSLTKLLTFLLFLSIGLLLLILG
ncbi:hypothetical protein DRP53_02860 [candidate division WOR-3 bacterium]|uniref:Uncharacterized protein n=1 Tax=candidate division WOR-3 bacterium TaxID=2052148 RepID=A0A660SLV7_UNCW3|nr:MAG: hypothetical protein DRP53_02860 [candidate division WOR-3 bacterium]